MANKLRAEANGCVVWLCVFLEGGLNCNGYHLLSIGNSAIISISISTSTREEAGMTFS